MIMVIIGVLSAVSVGRMMPNSVIQLQAARDVIVSVMFVAQQQALAQSQPVQVLISAGAIDIRRDDDGDGIYVAAESIRFAGVQYPLALPGNITVSTATFTYDQLGRTSQSSVQLSKGDARATVSVSEAGYAR